MGSEPISEDEIMQTGQRLDWAPFLTYGIGFAFCALCLFFAGRALHHLFSFLSTVSF